MAVTLGGNGEVQKSINSSWRLGLSLTWTTLGTHSAAARTWPAILYCCKPGWSHLRLESNLWLIGNRLTAPLAAAIHQAWIISLIFSHLQMIIHSLLKGMTVCCDLRKLRVKGDTFLSYQYTLVKHVQQHTRTQNSWTTTEIFVLSHRALGREHEELEIDAACTCWNY